MKYLFFLIIFLIPVGIANAESFTTNNPTNDGWVLDSTNNNLCDVGVSKNDTLTDLLVESYNTASAQDCRVVYLEYDISPIPVGAGIISANFTFDISGVDALTGNCDFVSMGTTRESDTSANIMTAILGGTVILENTTACTVAGNNILVAFNAAGNSQIQNRVAAGSGFFSFGIRLDNLVPDAINTRGLAIDSENAAGPIPPPTLSIQYVLSDAVTTLTATAIRSTAVDLSWTQPNLNGGSLTGYQINDTTPWASPLTIITNTNTLDTTATVSGLTGSTNYSFRVGTYPAINASGNIVNVTTLFDPTASFTVGTFDIDDSGVDTRPIVFDRNDINSTALFLNITYSDTWNLACNFHYKFANTNRTYTSIANTTVDSDSVMSAFQFNRIDNEIVDVYCWDQNTNSSGKYLITQSAFPLLSYIQNFRNGSYGTQGDFGVLDFVTLIAIIISMVGLNRASPQVGVIFSVLIIGGLSIFGIIDWPVIMTTSIVLIIVVVVGMVRKDD